MDYELSDYRPSNLVKVDLLLNGDKVDALSFIVHKDKAYARARRICEKLKENIPRQQFEVPIQAAIGGKIIARETVKALRKDVLAKCYGEGRPCQVLRRRHHPEEEAAGKAEAGQEEDALAGYGAAADGGVYGCAETGQSIRRAYAGR